MSLCDYQTNFVKGTDLEKKETCKGWRESKNALAKSSAVFYHSTMKKYDVVQHNNRHHCKYLDFYVFHVEVVFITGHEEDWGSGKRKRKLKGARRRKRSKHFLSPSPLLPSHTSILLFFAFLIPSLHRLAT